MFLNNQKIGTELKENVMSYCIDFLLKWEHRYAKIFEIVSNTVLDNVMINVTHDLVELGLKESRTLRPMSESKCRNNTQIK